MVSSKMPRVSSEILVQIRKTGIKVMGGVRPNRKRRGRKDLYVVRFQVD